ncbi:MAG: hypothetical protein AAGB16_00590 [Pseudomonadota bacterium]
MRYFLAAATGSLLSAGLFALPASASYMQKCDKLISAWAACQETSSACKAEQTAIETQCKCHVQKGDDWKLVNAAVEKDDVCGHPPEDITVPPPPSPPAPPITRNPPDPAGNGGKGKAVTEKDKDEGRPHK